MAYTEDDLQEALRQKYRNQEMDLTPESYNRLLGMDLTKVDVPTYPADLVGALMRGAESVTQAPMRSAMMASEQGGNPLQAALSQMGEPPETAPSMGDVDAAAMARLKARYPERVASAMLKPSDMAGIMSQADIPAAGPAMALGEIKGIIKGDDILSQLRTRLDAELAKPKPSMSVVKEIRKAAEDASRYRQGVPYDLYKNSIEGVIPYDVSGGQTPLQKLRSELSDLGSEAEKGIASARERKGILSTQDMMRNKEYKRYKNTFGNRPEYKQAIRTAETMIKNGVADGPAVYVGAGDRTLAVPNFWAEPTGTLGSIEGVIQGMDPLAGFGGPGVPGQNWVDDAVKNYINKHVENDIPINIITAGNPWNAMPRNVEHLPKGSKVTLVYDGYMVPEEELRLLRGVSRMGADINVLPMPNIEHTPEYINNFNRLNTLVEQYKQGVIPIRQGR